MKNIHYLFYITSKIILSINLVSLLVENAILFSSRRFMSKVIAMYHCTLNCTTARYYLRMTSHAFNGLSFFYHVTPYHPIK